VSIFKVDAINFSGIIRYNLGGLYVLSHDVNLTDVKPRVFYRWNVYFKSTSFYQSTNINIFGKLCIKIILLYIYFFNFKFRNVMQCHVVSQIISTFSEKSAAYIFWMEDEP
jgi:hypothetical protein